MDDVKKSARVRSAAEGPRLARGRCLCGAVEIEIGAPARWAWHDHTGASRRAHGAAYATYVGCYRSRVQVTKGEDFIRQYATPKAVRSFCATCGAPLMYARAHAPEMVNIPRALFDTRVGREPLYHIGIDELQDWTWTGERLTPLKGFPGVVWTGRRKKKITVEG